MLAELKGAGAAIEAEAAELEILELPLSELETQDYVNGMWRLEAAAVLLWSIGRLEFPRYDRLAQIEPIAKASGLLMGEIRPATTCRSQSEMERARELFFAVHWRLREFSLNARPMNFEEFAQRAWFGPLNLQELDLVERDLAFEGILIAKMKAESLKVMQSAATERHKAINWLTGEHEIYSQVSDNT